MSMNNLYSWYVDNVLAIAEGTTQHMDTLADLDTAAYGITEKSGLTQKAGESNRDFALRAVEKYASEARDAVGKEVFDALPDSVKIAVIDQKYNANIFGGFKGKLKEAVKTGNYAEAMKETLDVVGVKKDKLDAEGNVVLDAKGKPVQIKRAVPGLGRRRAFLYNFVAQDQGLPEITTIKPTKSGKGSKFTYEFDDDSSVEITTSRPLLEGSKESYSANYTSEPAVWNYTESEQKATQSSGDPVEDALKSLKDDGVFTGDEYGFFLDDIDSLIEQLESETGITTESAQKANEQALMEEELLRAVEAEMAQMEMPTEPEMTEFTLPPSMQVEEYTDFDKEYNEDFYDPQYGIF